MDLKEFVRKLVETEDQMERMALVEANQNLLETTGNVEGGAEGEENWKQKYEELKQKYISTFFGGQKEEPKDVEEKDEKTEEEKKAETIKIDDVIGGK